MDEVSFLEELLAIPSPSGQEDAVAAYLVGRMRALGLRAYRDEVGNAVGIAGGPEAGREIVLLGHMDTVPGLIPVRREVGRLHGRGAVDAKGPLAAFVLAAARVAPRLRGTRLRVIGAVEEEARSRGARHLARTLPPPDAVVIGEPSGWQGITLGYKGSLRVEYRLLRPAGHSAGQRPAVAEEAVVFWNRLQDYLAGWNRGRPGLFYTLDASLQQFRTFGDGLDDAVEMGLLLRLPPDAAVADLLQRMQCWCDGARLSFPDSAPAFQAERNTPPARALLRAIRAEGGQSRFKLKTGTSDMNVVGPAWGCPIVAYGPGDSSLDHTPEESIGLEEFRRGIRVLVRALATLGGIDDFTMLW